MIGILGPEVTGGLVAPPVFKTGVGLNKVPGGFDSHSPPPQFFRSFSFSLSFSWGASLAPDLSGGAYFPQQLVPSAFIAFISSLWSFLNFEKSPSVMKGTV